MIRPRLRQRRDLLCLGLLLLATGAMAAEPDARVAAAVKARDMTAARALLTAGASAATPLGDGATALHWAAQWDDADIADRLLKAGARADAGDDHRITPLGLAATNGSAAMIQRLLAAGANPNTVFETGETPFMRAVRVGRVEPVRILLAGGANVNTRETFRGQSALMWAVAFNHTDVVRLLTEAGADVKARSTAGFTPLLFAAQQGNLAIARTLVAAGADVNDVVRPSVVQAAPAPSGPGAGRRRRSDVDGSSVLQLAIDSGFMVTSRLSASADTLASGFSVSTEHEAVALFLLERGADPTRNGAGRTALHSAVRAARPALVTALLEKRADPNARLEQPLPRLLGQVTGDEIIGLVGTTPFWLAASYADVGLMRILAAAGADSTLPAADGTTPLMVAAGLGFGEGEDRYGHRWFGDLAPLRDASLEATKLALDLGGDVKALNDRGRGVLHAAAFVGGTTLPQLLIDEGADPNVRDKQGETPLSIANGIYRDGGYVIRPDTAAVLLKAGADPAHGSNPDRPK